MREQTKEAGNVAKEAFEEPALGIVHALGDSLMRHARVPCAFSVGPGFLRTLKES